MKLATLRDGSRDGRLLVVRRDGEVGAPAPDAWPTLQRALDDWDTAEPALRAVADQLDRGAVDGMPIDPHRLGPPLPRAYEWVDGSAFLNHVILVRKARGAEPPKTLETDPLIYQGGSGDLLGPRDPIELRDPVWGLDFESEVCIVLGDTPIGTTAADAHRYVRLVMLANDCTLRNLIPDELAKSFGFFQSKPATAFSPFAVTPDELESNGNWRDGRAHVRVVSTYNGQVVGDCEAGPEMHFSFFDLIQHVAKTRRFTAGTILGSGTVSNAERSRGISCLAERRMIEIIETGKPVTPFMSVGDRIEIEAFDPASVSLFGKIDQRIVPGGPSESPPPSRAWRSGMKLVLHNYWRSSASHRVRIGLGLKQLPYDYAIVNIVAREQHAAAYRSKNPMAQVPTLEITEDDGTVHALTQSLPILEFLDERFPEPPIMPKDLYLRARMRGLAEIVNSGIQPLQNMATTKQVVALGGDAAVWPKSFIADGLAAFERAARDVAGKFCVGDAPTVADCCLIPQLASARRFGVDLAQHELLFAIEARCLALPAFANASPDNQPDAVK